MGLRKAKADDAEAYVIARDIAGFELLTSGLDTELSGRWAPVELDTAESALKAGIGPELEFVIVAVTDKEESDLSSIIKIIKTARELGLKVLLVAKDVSPVALHQLMRTGAEDFAPYPLPEGSLSDSISRLRSSGSKDEAAAAGPRKRRGVILPVYGVAGGVGASTFAVNLAWELSQLTKKTDKRVALLDFNFQFGSVSTYLDLPRREAIYELISDPSAIDHDTMAQALTSYKTRLAVLTAPMDALPLDIVAPEDVQKLLEIAQSSYDFVVVDMPQALVHWSEDVLRMAETYFAILEVDMRSAQNALRFLRALKSEDLPYEKVQFALNRSPGFTDINGKARVKRLAESLGIEIDIMLPEGGRAVLAACDEGVPLSESAPKNALRKEIRNIATSVYETIEAQKAAVAH